MSHPEPSVSEEDILAVRHAATRRLPPLAFQEPRPQLSVLYRQVESAADRALDHLRAGSEEPAGEEYYLALHRLQIAFDLETSDQRWKQLLDQL